jgi:hypothetical protein
MTSQTFDTARLDELERLPWFGGKVVQLVRQRFGIESFGVNAWTASEVGADVIDEHDEESGGAGRHEELYVVVRGRARFTIAGEDLDAPAGTLVAVRDPSARRGAIALEAETTILAIGAIPGQPFTPSPWELSAAAIPAFTAGDYDRARAILASVLDERPDEPSVLYNLACAEARLGRRDEALAHLAEAAARPELAAAAQTDEDLASIRDDPRFPTAPETSSQ